MDADHFPCAAEENREIDEAHHGPASSVGCAPSTGPTPCRRGSCAIADPLAGSVEDSSRQPLRWVILRGIGNCAGRLTKAGEANFNETRARFIETRCPFSGWT